MINVPNTITYNSTNVPNSITWSSTNTNMQNLNTTIPNSSQYAYTTNTDYATTSTYKFVSYDEDNLATIDGNLIIKGKAYFNEPKDELSNQFLASYNKTIIETLKEKYDKLKWIDANDCLSTVLIVNDLDLDITIYTRTKQLLIQLNGGILVNTYVDKDLIDLIKQTTNKISRQDLLFALKSL